ncbi:MAG: Universal stress protein [Methanonatronarchaeales archaeon]|nr:Universal stress protein [Methanonatronarchaeales archaeon]
MKTGQDEMFKRILVPTDGSQMAAEATEGAVDLARSVGGELTFLYVVDTALTSGIPEDWAWEQLEAVLREEGERALDEAGEAAEEVGVEFSTVLLEGIPHREIVDYAADNDVDLIVIATAGRRGLDRLLMGSTTDRVLRGAGCPVLVIRRGQE